VWYDPKKSQARNPQAQSIQKVRIFILMPALIHFSTTPTSRHSEERSDEESQRCRCANVAATSQNDVVKGIHTFAQGAALLETGNSREKISAEVTQQIKMTAKPGSF
jgi:hypothetical protein